MKPEQKKAINRTILKCREILEKDIENRLVTYGILMDEPWIEKDKLSLSDEQEQIYKDLRDAIAKEMKGGLSEKEALISYIREVTYTYLNRIAALRVMEVRGLMEEVLVQKEKYSNRSYGHRNFFEIAREFCKSQSDEGLSYFISLIFNEISSDIGLLFNTDDEYSIIGPSNHALVEIIRLLTTDIDEESWYQDEIIGWIYQYFNSLEKKDVFEKTRNANEKIDAIEIPAATQLFTPDWIVSWIIQNSLGQLRKEYLEGTNKYKKLEDLKLIDPACGSGHFLVQAYNLFYQYYIEDGYPKEKIPFLILQHNLHGIDIDARAIQLTALILYIKVRVSLKEVGIHELTEKIIVNLVCADVVLLNGERLSKMKKQFEKNPTALQMIDIIYEEFKETKSRGSLIQPEKKLLPLIEEYKVSKQKELKKKKNKQDYGDLFADIEGFEQEQEETLLTQSERELFNYLEKIYYQALSGNDINNLLFANEAKKSIKLLNIFMNKYDVVVANPPYMGKSSMNDSLKDFVNASYEGANHDLYAVFIKRCIDFLGDYSKLGMVTQHGFMFTTLYNKFREYLLKTINIEKVVHLGPRAFDDISGEKVNTAMFIFNRGLSINNGQFTRLINYKNSIDKKTALEDRRPEDIYNIDQAVFKFIKGSPFVYWILKEISDLIKKNPSIKPSYTIKTGMRLGQVHRFVRKWWEIKPENIQQRWKFFANGGKSARYYASFENVIDWSDEALEIYDEKKYHRNKNYYFKNGWTWSNISSKNFKLKILEPNMVFDGTGNYLSSDNELDFYYIAGYLNTDLVSYILKMINPTLHYNTSDLERVPLIEINKEEIAQLTKENVSLLRKYFERNECNYDFKEFKIEKCNLRENYQRYFSYIQEIEDKVSNNREIINQYFFRFLNLDNTALSKIYSELDDESNFLTSDISIEDYVFDLISYFIGLIFGRWENKSLNLSKDGILIIDESLLDNYIYDLIDYVFGEDNFEEIIEKEIPEILKKDLISWLKKDFFTLHISKYDKRPIYLHICSPNKTFNALLYYHAITVDTLYKLKSNYIKPILENFTEDLSFYREKMSSTKDKKLAKQFEKRVIEIEKQVDDLEAFDKQIDQIIASGYEPDIDQGVLYNIKPLNPILAKKIEK
ncbi:BREX-1 system adenine-specific DNA-methyltransferase PglX [Bacillus subtilis]|uniref:BREX-1 system adenine-specific DNA-methyltransferase PglX n=1 Tax=Bacillus subtilis TaxID=1423 RepID=UPI0009B67A3A|nr:BREX-1 system adenine-specific DNA-methyltransferase PglX [Bacillus subtilis]ARB36093.1 hypothetical protein BSK2_03695 [Bacillus subtilis]MCM3158603.1 BREX-1 system adenine-specific DNA-methyltransferase PglX [Bacillus subtilis]QCU14002.1 BREX-1 system adenine-specific DNA-methyltransferase PglX [Bacillus subtilis]